MTNPIADLRIMSGLKTKLVKPSLYSMYLENEGKRYMHVCVEFSLEGAEEDALNTLKRDNPELFKKGSWSVVMYDTKTIEEISSLLEDTKLSPREHTSDRSAVKNIVMKEILDNQDIDLYDKYKKILNGFEKRYIEDALARRGVALKKRKEAVKTSRKSAA